MWDWFIHFYQVTKAEILWALKTVDSNLSYMSADNLASLLQAMDPRSEVFKKMTLGATKTSYILSHGLLPYFMKKIIQSIQTSNGYTLGTDAGTFKLHGLSKLVDIVLRLLILLSLLFLLLQLLILR